MEATPPPRTCPYEFRDERRPRPNCGLPGHGPAGLCVWHDPSFRAVNFDVKEELQKEVARPRHWLEGAILTGEKLSNAFLFRAKLPFADLQLADLSGAFLAEAYLSHASFRSARLSSAKLNRSTIVDCQFDGAVATGAVFEDADLSAASLQGTTFDGAYLHGVKLSADTISYNADWRLPGEFLDGHFDRAAHVFRTLSGHFHAVSYHGESSRFYFLEMTALHLAAIQSLLLPVGTWDQKLRSWCAPLREPALWITWAGWSLHRWLWGYGVRPLRPLLWMAVIILSYGFVIFPALGVVSGAGTCPSHDPFVGLSLSLVTFATLGYGNRTPVGTLGEFLGGLEALVGVLLTSVFLVSLATRYVHRG